MTIDYINSVYAACHDIMVTDNISTLIIDKINILQLDSFLNRIVVY